MRIAFIRQRYNPYGGAERFIERATQALAAQGADISVIAREWPAVPDDASHRYVRCNPAHKGRLSRDLTFAAEACGIVERGAFDLVQSHERLPCCDIFRAGDGVHAQWLEQRARARSPLDRLATRLSLYHRYIIAAERRVFASPRLQAVICNSEMVRNDILRHHPVDPQKLRVLYNGVDLEHFHPRLRETLRSEMRSRLGIAATEYVYLFVGSGFERKGVDRLLRAFARLGTGDARAIIVGEDRDLPQSRRLAARLGIGDRVWFAGGQQDVRPYYAVADAFVLPTLYDPFPNAALEALACGLPVITTFQCGAAELIESGCNGGVCDALDDSALTRLMADVAQMESTTAVAQARASVAHLDIASMANRLLALYQELMAHKL